MATTLLKFHRDEKTFVANVNLPQWRFSQSESEVDDMWLDLEPKRENNVIYLGYLDRIRTSPVSGLGAWFLAAAIPLKVMVFPSASAVHTTYLPTQYLPR